MKTILIWGHILSRDRFEVFATEYSTNDNVYSKDCKWTVTGVSKYSKVKLGDVVNIAKEWDYGWIIIRNAIERGNLVVDGWGNAISDRIKDLNKDTFAIKRAVIWWPNSKL